MLYNETMKHFILSTLFSRGGAVLRLLLRKNLILQKGSPLAHFHVQMDCPFERRYIFNFLTFITKY